MALEMNDEEGTRTFCSFIAKNMDVGDFWKKNEKYLYQNSSIYCKMLANCKIVIGFDLHLFAFARARFGTRTSHTQHAD